MAVPLSTFHLPVMFVKFSTNTDSRLVRGFVGQKIFFKGKDLWRHSWFSKLDQSFDGAVFNC